MIVGVALERSTVRHMIARVGRHPEQEIGERVAGEGAAKPIPTAVIDAEAKPVASGVVGPEAAALERVGALDPRDVVAQRKGVLSKGSVDVASGIGDVGRPVRSRRELELEAAPVGAEARRVLDAELGGDVRRQERAFPPELS